jgi:hypothetical protein
MRCLPDPTAVPNIGLLSPPIEACKVNDVDPLAYLTDVLTRIANGHAIDQLLSWSCRGQYLKAVA